MVINNEDTEPNHKSKKDEDGKNTDRGQSD
jgi:hypothetical protein